MKASKVFATGLLTLSFVATLAGCGGSTATNSAPTSPSAPAASPAPTQDLLAQIKQKGVLTIGTSNDVPFAFMEANTSNLKGIDAEFIQTMAKNLGVKVEVYVTDFSTLIPALQAKKFDMIVDAMYITDKRKELINFTDPWYKEGEAIVVRKDEKNIKSADDLKGLVVGGQTGTVFLDWVKSLPTKEVKIYDSQATALLDLNNKKIDAVVTDSATAAYTILHDPSLNLQLVSPYTPHFGGIIGAGVRKEDTSLLNEINNQLKQLKQQGQDLTILSKYGLAAENRMP